MLKGVGLAEQSLLLSSNAKLSLFVCGQPWYIDLDICEFMVQLFVSSCSFDCGTVALISDKLILEILVSNQILSSTFQQS